MNSIIRATRSVLMAGLVLLACVACGQSGDSASIASPAPATTPNSTPIPNPTAAATIISTAQPTTAPTAALASPSSVAATALPTAMPTRIPTNTLPTAPPATLKPTQALSAPTLGTHKAEIKLFMFEPNPLAITTGTTVTWLNTDAVEHSITSGTPASPTGVFDSGFFTEGHTFSHTFSSPGEFAFFCARHPTMMGKVVVSAAHG